VIETSRCYIKLTTTDDIFDIKSLYTDIEVWKYLGGQRSPKQINRGINSRIYPDKGCTYWTVRNKETNEFLGNISLTPHHDSTYTEISYEFLSYNWGNGYASETVGEIIKLAFNTLGLRKLVAETQSANSASCNMLRKFGFFEKQKIIRFGTEQIIWAINNHTRTYIQKG